jgi:tRNA threonylcarbamoyladenosine biosynthesis protein TsaB
LNTLAIDTATESLGLCLQTENTSINFSMKIGLKHTQRLVPWIERLCGEANLQTTAIDLLVVSIGPGSFTGLRIGLATAKGFAIGAGCDLVGVPTLDTWAWSLRYFDGIIVPALDAKKSRIYAAFYRDGEKISDYLDLSPEDLASEINSYRKKETPIIVTGPFAPYLIEKMKKSADKPLPFLDPGHAMLNPAFLLDRGKLIFNREGSHGHNLTPLYLRKSEAEIHRAP